MSQTETISFDAQPCRRRRRGRTAQEALTYQLLHVAEVLGLDAIVIADELGMPVAQAGDPEVSNILANSAMWAQFTNDDIDDISFEALSGQMPEVQKFHVVSIPINLPHVEGTSRLLLVGHSDGRSAGAEHAARGIGRICREYLN